MAADPNALGPLPSDAVQAAPSDDSLGPLPSDEPPAAAAKDASPIGSPSRPDLSSAPIGTVLKTAGQNIVPQAKEIGEGLKAAWNDPAAAGSALLNEAQTGIGQGVEAAKGAYSMAKDAAGFGTPDNPNDPDVAHARSVASKWGDAVKDWTAGGGWKNTVGYSPLTTAANLAPGLQGVGKVAEMLPLLSTVGKVAGAAGDIIDPVQIAAKAAKLPLQAAAAVGNRTAAPIMADVSPKMAALAQQAGASSNPVFRQAFNDASSGAIDGGQLVDKVNATIGNMANVKSQNFVKGLTEKVGMNGGASTLPNLSWDPIETAIQKAYNNARTVDPATGVMTVTNKEAFDALNNLSTQAQQLRSAAASNPASIYNNVQGFDAFKKSVGDQWGNTMSPGASDAMNTVYKSVLDTINAKHPGYADVMQGYQDALSKLKSLKSVYGSSKQPVTTQLNKILKTTTGKSSFGMKDSLLDDLANPALGGDASLPYTMAGMATHEFFPGGLRSALEAPAALLAAGHPLLGIPGAAGYLAASSPKVWGKANYAIGSMGRYAKAASPIAQVPFQAQQAQQNGFAKGGAVKPEIRALVDRLHRLAERAKKRTKKETEPLLDKPDHTIIRALAVAKAAI